MQIAETVTFGGSALDRAARIRGDEGALSALRERPGATAILLWSGEPLVQGEDGSASSDAALGRERLARVHPNHPALAGAAWAFLGLDEGEGVWAAALQATSPGLDAPDEGRRWADLRSVMAALPPRDAELAATARALLGWHATHGFCAACGTASRVTHAGWQRDCPACGAHHFPRTDPVVIMLVTRGNDVLLGRSPGWPEGMHSLLAGFVEPGETVEAAVRREVWEEAGVRVGRVGYLASQPWPFPASLMLGCRGEALSAGITLDPVELEAAAWVSRERLARVVAGRDEAIRAPRAGAIASFLLHAWLADRLD